MMQAAIRDGHAMERTVLAVPGVHCAGCISKVENGLAGLPGMDDGAGGRL